MTTRHGQHNKINHPISWNFGGVEGYQFAGTGETRVQNYEDPTIPGRFLPRLYHTLVKPLTSGGKPVDETGKPLSPGAELVVHAVPMISNFNEGESTQGKKTYKWDYIEDLMEIHNFLGKPPRKLKAWLINQPDGQQQNFWHGIKANKFLLTTWSQGKKTLYIHDKNKRSAAFVGNQEDYRDDGYDAAPSIYSVTSDPVIGKDYRPGIGSAGIESAADTDWFRHGCIQIVKYTVYDDNGKAIEKTRDFMIYFDIEHKFYAFPTAARLKDKPKTGMESINAYGYVPMSHVKKLDVPWPTNVDKDKIGKNVETQYRPDWSFSHNGKKAVCVALIIDEPWTSGSVITSSVYLDNEVQDIKESSPIMIEIEFTINVTGKELDAFDFEITLGRVIDPEETGRSIVYADYAVKDFQDKGVKADDLIILEYEMFRTDMTIPTPALHLLKTYEGVQYAVDDYCKPFGLPFPTNTSLQNSYLSYKSSLAAYNKMAEEWDEPYPLPPFVHYYVLNPLPDTTTTLGYCASSAGGIIINTNSYSHIGDPYIVDEGNYLIQPNLASIAKVKNLGTNNLDGPVLFEWCAHYSSKQIYKNQNFDFEEGLIFNHAKFDDFNTLINDTFIKPDAWLSAPESPPETWYEGIVQDVFYQASIQSIELSTLSFCIAASMSFSGRHFKTGTRIFNTKEESMSGALQILTVFGEEVLKQYKGFPLIENQLETIYRLTSTKPNIKSSKYKKFDLRATIDSSPTTPRMVQLDQWNPPNYADLQHFSYFDINSTYPGVYFLPTYPGWAYNPPNEQQECFVKANTQTLTINDGINNEFKFRVFNSARVNNTNDNMFKFYTNYKVTDNVFSPTVFTYFDSVFCFRPGFIRQETSSSNDGTVVNTEGSSFFVGYPFGKIYFNRVHVLTTHPTSNTNNKLSTHPNGSWAIYTMPIVVYTEKHSMLFEITSGSEVCTIANGAGTITKEQLIIDKIHMVYQHTDTKTKTITNFIKDTTHLEMFNKAFNKSYALEDYEFKITNTGNSYIPFSEWNALFYTGGFKLEDKFVNPALETIPEHPKNAFHEGGLGDTDISKIFSPFFIREFAEIGFFFDSAFQTVNKPHHSKFNYMTNSFVVEPGVLFQYVPTPRMEAMFFFQNPYIDRTENNQ
jgi:hypothetical protein